MCKFPKELIGSACHVVLAAASDVDATIRAIIVWLENFPRS